MLPKRRYSLGAGLFLTNGLPTALVVENSSCERASNGPFSVPNWTLNWIIAEVPVMRPPGAVWCPLLGYCSFRILRISAAIPWHVHTKIGIPVFVVISYDLLPARNRGLLGGWKALHCGGLAGPQLKTQSSEALVIITPVPQSDPKHGQG